ncbi:hypothetical protein LP419_02615 [Massilia sp. H-1]|nr:hypothetical protein LP419_02615 [Massilia sp. H-1]
MVRQINYGPRFEQARPALAIDTAADIAMNFRKLAAKPRRPDPQQPRHGASHAGLAYPAQ